MKKLASAWLICPLGISLIFLSGCRTCTEAMWNPGLGGNQFVEPSATTQSRVSTIKELKGKSVGGVLQGSAVVESRSSSQQQIEYQFTWYDKDGFVTGNDSPPWQPVTLYPRGTQQLQAVGPNTLAASYKIQICTR